MNHSSRLLDRRKQLLVSRAFLGRFGEIYQNNMALAFGGRIIAVDGAPQHSFELEGFRPWRGLQGSCRIVRRRRQREPRQLQIRCGRTVVEDRPEIAESPPGVAAPKGLSPGVLRGILRPWKDKNN